MVCGLVFAHGGYSGGGSVVGHRWAAGWSGGDCELAVAASSGGAAGAGPVGRRGRGGERGDRTPVRGEREHGAGLAEVRRRAGRGWGGGGGRGSWPQAVAARGHGR